MAEIEVLTTQMIEFDMASVGQLFSIGAITGFGISMLCLLIAGLIFFFKNAIRKA